MDDIRRLAEELGQKIAAHPRFAKLRDAENRLTANPALKQLVEEYEALFAHTQELEHGMQPVEPADKRKLMDMQRKISADPLIQEVVQCQADYAELMYQVNHAIRTALGLKDEE